MEEVEKKWKDNEGRRRIKGKRNDGEEKRKRTMKKGTKKNEKRGERRRTKGTETEGRSKKEPPPPRVPRRPG